MNFFLPENTNRTSLAPERYGASIKGGGHPADESVPAEEEILDTMDQLVPSRGRIPGTNDPGAPGSRTEHGQDKPLDDESALPFHHRMDTPRDEGSKGEHVPRSEGT